MAIQKQRFKLYPAFGQWKTINEWARDPRCRVSRQGLYLRVLTRGLSIAEAFQAGAFDPGRSRGKWAMRLTIQGESKTIAEWASDPRCKVTEAAVRYRMANGWPHEPAVLSPAHAPAPPEVLRTEQKRGRPSPVVVAWGEKKTLAQWGRDSRANVSAAVMTMRLGKGFTPEDAIAHPPWKRQDKQENCADVSPLLSPAAS